MSQPIFVPIPLSQLGGAIAVNVFAALSKLALVSVALRVIWLAIQRYWFKTVEEPQEYVFFHTQLGQYAACLIIAMIFNTVAGIIGIPWLFRRGITEGWICRSQALVMQTGNFSAGYFTVIIAVHTFGSLVMRKRQSALICRTVIILGWIFAGLLAAAPFLIRHPEGYVYGADGLACGVRSVFPKLQFFFHLLPILIASILGAILYSLIFLVLRGTLKVKGGIKLTLNPNERWTNGQGLGENYHRFIARVARSMLWYPVAYIALLVPYSIMRLLIISGFAVPFEAVVFAFTCWYSLSVVDVLLLYNTFRVLGPAFDGRSSASTQKDLEAFSKLGQLEKSDYPSAQKRSVREENIKHYRAQGSQGSFPVLLSRQLSENSFSTTSAKSMQNLISSQHERNMSDLSISSRPNAALIGRPITPASDYNWIISSPPPGTSPTTSGGREAGHIRDEPSSSKSLPVPPRRTRTLRAIPEPLQSLRQFEEQDTSMRTTNGRPMLSAVTPSFPGPLYPRSPPRSATSPIDRSRPTNVVSPSQSQSPTYRQHPLLYPRGSPLDTTSSLPSRPSILRNSSPR